MMSCFLKVGFGRNHYVFLILNDELIEKLALIKLYFCCKVGRQQQQRTANPEIDNCVISCNGWVALLPK